MKTETIVITCDGCNEVIKPAINMDGYILQLSSPGNSVCYEGQAFLCVAVLPILENNCHFHNFACLKLWINRIEVTE